MSHRKTRHRLLNSIAYLAAVDESNEPTEATRAEQYENRVCSVVVWFLWKYNDFTSTFWWCLCNL